MKAKSSLRRYLSIIQGGGRKSTVSVFALGLFAVSSAFGAKYYWKGGSSWADYGTLSNWSTENATDGAAAESLPGSGDSVENQTCYFDMGGGEYTLGKKTEPSGSGSGQFRVRNGTLHISSSASVQNAGGYVVNGGKLIIDSAATLTVGLWNGGTGTFHVDDGGTLQVDGKLDMWNGQVEITSGGTFILNGRARYSGDNYVRTARIYNKGGSAIITNGFANTTSVNANTPVILRQTSGSLTLGGDIDAGSYSTTFDISGGTIHVISDCAVRATTATMSGTSITVEIDEGVAFDISDVVLSVGAITKTGAGDFTYMPGNMPTSLVVNEGGLLLDTADLSYDLSGVTFASGAKVKIGAFGVTLTSCDSSISSATFDVADGLIPSSGATVLTCADSTVLAQAQAGLNASLASVGISVEIDGNSLVAESHYTFNSSTISDMNDTSGWVNGLAAPAGQPAIIAGSTTEAVMDNAVPDYASIDVTDGATLTVAATRDLPATTLAAGTSLRVAATSGITYETRNHPDYLTSTAVAVGAMDPSLAVTEIAGIAGIVGGLFWNTGTAGTDYDRVTTASIDNGATLRAQFKKLDTPYTKCVIVDFTKDAEGVVYAKTIAAKYIEANNLDYDFAASGNAGTVATSDSSGGYGVKGLTFQAPYAAGSPVAVTATGDFIAAGSGSVTVDVAADCVLDLSGVDVTTEAALVKTGDGTLILGNAAPSALDVQAGSLALQPYVEYDMSGVTLGNGVSVVCAVDGAFKPAVGSSLQDGNTIYTFPGVYNGIGGWNATANWTGGVVPGASDIAHVYGEDTVLTLDDATITLPAAFVVEAGATLSVAADINLPPITVVPGATLDIASGTVSIVNGFSSSALVDGDDVTLPVLLVERGATLSVPSGMKFKNIDFRLYGIAQKSGGTSDVGPTIGYAESGETSYIAFTSDGGTFNMCSSQDAAKGQIDFVCPDNGGRVKVVGEIGLTNVTMRPTSWAHFGYRRIGLNNPVDEPFRFILSNTKLPTCWSFVAAGAAKVELTDGSYVEKLWDARNHGFNSYVQDAATVSMTGSGSYLDYEGASSFCVDSSSATDAVAVKDGGAYLVGHAGGKGKGVFVADGGILGVTKLTDSRAKSNLLAGFGSARLDGDLLLSSTNMGRGNTDWERRTTMANIPFTGTGDVVVTNGVPAYPFTVTMQNGANTATGSIKVAKVEGDAETALYFANGANWAGTVVAGNVALTNLTDGAAAASVTFGTLDLAADFPIRVWKSEGVYSADAINVGSFINNGGKISPVMMSEGEDFVRGDSFVIGKVAKGAALPAVASGWALKTRSINGDDAYDEIVLKSGVGLQIIVR